MSFNQVFALLMLGSLLASLLLPTRWPDRFKGTFQGVFSPLSRPVASVAAGVQARLGSRPPTDETAPATPRSPDDVYRENTDLRMLVVSLEGQLQALRELNAERERVGPVRRLCIPVRVAGGDGGLRPLLNLTSGTLSGVAVGQAVLYAGGLVGVISRAGESGSTVRLVTDPEMRIAGSFGRFTGDPQTPFQRLAIEPAVAAGTGRGEMIISTLKLEDVRRAGLRPETDWFILDDRGWPLPLQGFRIGVIKSVTPKRDAPLFAEVRIAPTSDLMLLNEVQVLTRPGG
jgi:hypothetical protein